MNMVTRAVLIGAASAVLAACGGSHAQAKDPGPAHGAATARVEAKTTMTTGSREPATLVIENHTGHPVALSCGPIAELTNATTPWVEPSVPVRCPATQFGPGVSRLPFVVSAAHGGCSTVEAGPSICDPLPPGDYKLEMRLGTEINASGNVTIHVTRSDRFSARIELPSDTLEAGTNVEGTLVIENGTGSTMSLSDKNGCALPWDVLLGNDKVKQPLVRTAICSATHRSIPPGETRWTFTLSGSYVACVVGGGRPLDELRPCGPLPVGDYLASLVGAPALHADPVSVHVVR